MIDNLWTIAIERADLAGKELAHVILSCLTILSKLFPHQPLLYRHY
jgi:hypothetical protein